MRRLLVLLTGVLLSSWLVLPASAAPPPDTVEELVQRLRADPVQVAPAMGAGHTEEVDRAITDVVARSPVPVHVVLDLAPQELEGTDDPAEELLPLLAAELGPGVYVLELGETTESIIGSYAFEAVGVDQDVLGDFYAGRSTARELTDPAYPTSAFRTYLGVVGVVEGQAGLDSLDEQRLLESGWAVRGDLDDTLEAEDERVIVTGVVVLVVLAAALGSRLRTRRWRRRLRVRPSLARTSLAVLGALALAAGAGAGAWTLSTARIPPPPQPGDQALAAARDFASGATVHVSPDLARWMTPERRARIEAMAAQAQVPTRVVFWYPTQEGDALQEVATATDLPGLYVSASPDGVEAFDHRLAGDTYYSRGRVESEAGSDEIAFLVAEVIRDSDEEGPREVVAPPRSDYYGGTWGSTIGAGVMIGLLAGPVGLVVGLLLATPTVRRLRRYQSGWLPTPPPVEAYPAPTTAPVTSTAGPAAEPDRPAAEPDRPSAEPDRPSAEADGPAVLPGSAAAAVTAAAASAGSAAASTASTARDESSAPDPVEVAPASAATTALAPREPREPASWEVSGWRRAAEFELANLQRTLRFLSPGAAATPAAEAAGRHAAAAEALLGRSEEPADLLGAGVLARRGADAARAATALRDWTPQPGCFFHPEHPAGAEQRVFEGREVPCCRACAAHLDAGRTPELLDLPGPVHFHRSGAEPWASTGFGALEPDLPGRLAAP